LLKAAEKNRPKIGAMLLEAGADPNMHNNEGCCPIIRSSKMGHFEMVKLLIDHKANINEKSLNGNTALMKATEAGHEDIARYLIDRGAALLLANDLGLTAYDFSKECAKVSGNWNIVRMIEKRMERDREEGAAFLDAVLHGDEDKACELIYSGVSLDVGYEDGCCPIIKSASNGYDRIVKALIEMKSDLNKVCTSLYFIYAVRSIFIQIFAHFDPLLI